MISLYRARPTHRLANWDRNWDPVGEMQRLTEHMSRLFDDSSLADTQRGSRVNGFYVPVDVEEDEKGITVRADVAGVQPEDIQVTVDSQVLTISGERKLEHQEEGKDGTRRLERSFGSFMRSFTLPDYADAEQIQAETKNGVLTLRIGRKAETKSRRIEIKSDVPRMSENKTGPGPSNRKTDQS